MATRSYAVSFPSGDSMLAASFMACVIWPLCRSTPRDFQGNIARAWRHRACNPGSVLDLAEIRVQEHRRHLPLMHENAGSSSYAESTNVRAETGPGFFALPICA